MARRKSRGRKTTKKKRALRGKVKKVKAYGSLGGVSLGGRVFYCEGSKCYPRQYVRQVTKTVKRNGRKRRITTYEFNPDAANLVSTGGARRAYKYAKPKTTKRKTTRKQKTQQAKMKRASKACTNAKLGLKRATSKTMAKRNMAKRNDCVRKYLKK